MTRRLSCLLGAAAVLLVSTSMGTATDTRRPDHDLADLAWMAGHWRSDEPPLVTEEVWMAPRGGLMLGLHRDVNEAYRRASFEYLRIEATEDGIVYLASPSGHPPTAFPLVRLEEHEVVFENPDHDFPQRLVYRRDGERLVARAEAKHDGATQALEWTWQRIRD